jgi:hypothetical protein
MRHHRMYNDNIKYEMCKQSFFLSLSLTHTPRVAYTSLLLLKNNFLWLRS